MSHETPTIATKIKELEQQVNQYATGKEKKSIFSFGSIVNLKYIYIAIPVALFFLFIFWRPQFLYYDYMNDRGIMQKKFHIKKFLIWWVILSLICDIGIFVYMYKKKNN